MPVIDASVFVAIVNRADAHHDACRTWFEQAVNNGDRLLAPNILMSETAAAISRGAGNEALARAIVTTLAASTVIELIPIGNSLAAAAAEIAATRRIRGCDAVYVALASSVDEALVTLDQQQLTRSSGLIAVMSPSTDN
ncbi:MAG: type II toxin-antitoxin system VapC family toxin [Caldilineaceae bacterium]|nr:type II toxin-antitoxin system VapC family toxin [Caldilineaceae bacterium]